MFNYDNELKAVIKYYNMAIGYNNRTPLKPDILAIQ